MLNKLVKPNSRGIVKQIFSRNFFSVNKLYKQPIKGVKFNKLEALLFSTQSKPGNVIDVPEEPDIEFVQSNKENLGFKAETRKLLDIVTHSLYTDKEIFLRELLSNCSDALEKQRYLEVTGKLQMTGEPLFISVSSNDKSKTLTIFDSGVGMTREEMVENLGTIAKSGTQNFLKAIEANKGNPDSLIGQFGVGFYSSFMVGEKIEVVSRTQDGKKATLWVSDGSGEFSVSDVENCEFNRGTKIIIHLKPECREFAKANELKKIISKHSNFISYSIKLNGEVVNNLQAIWYREKKDVTMEEYQKFYEMLANNTKLPYKYVIHFKSDVPLEVKALLYIPGATMEKFGMNEENVGVSLYSKKVLIKQKCLELLPNYLRMIKGVVDCADIPLSISRETYQDSSLIFKLKTLITKRVLKRLEEESINDPENYDKWYDEFHQQLKEGIVTDHDNSENLLRLQRFKATFTTNRVGIEDYIKKMIKDQEKIYFLVNTDIDNPHNSVYLEAYKKTELPILITSNPFDEVIFKQINSYKNHKFVNIENESDDFLNAQKHEDSSSVNKLPEEDITAFTLWIKNELEPYVSKVVLSKRLSDTPILITSQISATMKAMMAIMQQDKEQSNRDYTVEINPSHKVIVGLNRLRKNEPKVATLGIKQLFDTAMLQANLPFNNKDYVKRTFLLLDVLVSTRTEPNSDEAVKVERLEKESLQTASEERSTSKNADLFAEFKIGKK